MATTMSKCKSAPSPVVGGGGSSEPSSTLAGKVLRRFCWAKALCRGI